MEHGVSWLTFLPGFVDLEVWLAAHFHGLRGTPAVFQHVAAAALVILILFGLALWVRRDLAAAAEGGLVPRDAICLRNAVEVGCEVLYEQMKQTIGPDCARYFPVLASLALFILVSNLLGLVPGMLPPTDNWNTTFACGAWIFLYYNYHGLRAQGWAYVAHIANPVGAWWGWFLAPLMLPIELVGHCVRPFSLGIRLATNMMVDHLVGAVFLGLVPFLVPIPFMLLGLMVSLIQTIVFTLLSMIYIGLATADAHAHDGHEAADDPHHGHPVAAVA